MLLVRAHSTHFCTPVKLYNNDKFIMLTFLPGVWGIPIFTILVTQTSLIA